MIFWDLNYSLGCSPLATHAYPAPPFPSFYDAAKFGVGQETEGFLPLNPQSVSLPFQLSQLRFDCGQLWQEPAIAGLDWLFTPNPKSEERLSAEPLQASTMYYHRFTLPWVRSTRFGSYSNDLQALSYLAPRKLRANCFRCGCSNFRIILATEIHSLARYSKRTAQLRRAVPHHDY